MKLTNEDYKISIIIPAYNVQEYIKQCLESIINQTYKNLEIIVVNDGSKDKTLDIIESIAKDDPRIIVINQENQGVSAARNNALKGVDGDFVMFVDSDDWLDLDTCEVLIKEAVKENADIVMCGYVREYKEKSMPKAMFDEERIIFKNEEVKDKLHRRIFGPLGNELSTPEKLNANTTIWAKLYRQTTIKTANFISLKELGICEDGWFNIDAFKNANKVVFVKKHFYHYRKMIDGGSLTQNKEKNIYKDAKKFYSMLCQKIKEEELPQDYKTATNNRFALCLVERVNGQNIVYNNLNEILHDEQYEEAIKNIELKYFPLHWKLFFMCAKAKFTFGIYVLLKIIDLILSAR